MTADQRPTYQPKPVTQRDGSALANSNCRMASIATGLDFETKGGKTSSGAKMRSYTTDQSGGTDSGDAAQAWKNGYSETLSIRDGQTFDAALADLRAGRLVHLDVWHATTAPSPGICLSGSGAYGHTLAVLPDCSAGSWLVADPWCSPPKWGRVPESKLRAGAEEWGRRVYSMAEDEADWPTSGDMLRAPAGVGVDGDKRAAIVRRVARDHMDRFHPGGLEDHSPDPGPHTPGADAETVGARAPGGADTAGAQPILFTRTAPQPLQGDEPMGIRLKMVASYSGMARVVGPNHSAIRIHDGAFIAMADGVQKRAYAKAITVDPIDTPAGGYTPIPANQPCVIVGDVEAILLEKDIALTPDDTGDIEQRDLEWEAWVLNGAPSRT